MACDQLIRSFLSSHSSFFPAFSRLSLPLCQHARPQTACMHLGSEHWAQYAHSGKVGCMMTGSSTQATFDILLKHTRKHAHTHTDIIVGLCTHKNAHAQPTDHLHHPSVGTASPHYSVNLRPSEAPASCTSSHRSLRYSALITSEQLCRWLRGTSPRMNS